MAVGIKNIQKWMNGEVLRSKSIQKYYKLAALIVVLIFVYILGGYHSMQQHRRLSDLKKEVKDIKFAVAYYGDIFIDDVPTKSLTRENLHELFDMILKDTWLFNGTVKENLIYIDNNIRNESLAEIFDKFSKRNEYLEKENKELKEKLNKKDCKDCVFYSEGDKCDKGVYYASGSSICHKFIGR